MIVTSAVYGLTMSDPYAMVDFASDRWVHRAYLPTTSP